MRLLDEVLREIADRLLAMEIRLSNMESWMKEREEMTMAADVLTIEELISSKTRAERMYADVRGVTPEAERMRDALRKRIRLLDIRIQRAKTADYEEEVAKVLRTEG